jgi:hypothetical protein
MAMSPKSSAVITPKQQLKLTEPCVYGIFNPERCNAAQTNGRDMSVFGNNSNDHTMVQRAIGLPVMRL